MGHRQVRVQCHAVAVLRSESGTPDGNLTRVTLTSNYHEAL